MQLINEYAGSNITNTSVIWGSSGTPNITVENCLIKHIGASYRGFYYCYYLLFIIIISFIIYLLLFHLFIYVIK
jgi:hypothetical protein